MRRTRRKSKGSVKKIFLTIGIVLLFLAGIGGGYAFYLYKSTSDMVSGSYEETGRDKDQSDMREKPVDPVEDNVSILFIGVDDSEHRDEEDTRSDALLLATFNQEENNVKLLSIPRDSYVYVPEVGYNTKINHAHAYGGARAAIETVEEFLQVPVDYYVRMDFNAFVDVVDAVGGIKYDIPYEFKESNSDDEKESIHLTEGYQHLNGEEALALARTRKHDSDVARGKRQQELLMTIAKKATSAESVLKIDDVFGAVGDNMSTNLTFPEMRGFLSYGLDQNVEMETINLDGSGGYSQSGAWYYYVRDESRQEVASTLRSHLEIEDSQEITDYASKEENQPDSY
ncbi:LCP family glycopolymer transferase [Thalassobacillus sp. B23F22_16]|uniref:LCP family glycopolymer transferase n=1 Tax=Thalassobacillus sp. B23F22_16 TaxID=3459513 RepID=UPI00373E4726